ncbi:YveK family protein [Candidatus Blastococcus massiliensis]|uniref:YveK family protein n=1 Tax=Candidatus Blastococcus massiliensis TaxID=1470358 RepID=UPI0004BA35AC|nr:Wzz/FepE/Etk N-terminal domain-containing protein [Candidatus Blastococcus massiliensis]
MQLREVLSVIRRNKLVILLTVVLGLAAGWTVTALAPETYETETKVLIEPVVSGPVAVDPGQAAAIVANQVATYAVLAETPAVLEPAIEASGVDVAATDLVGQVSSELIPRTSIITITVQAETATDAADLAEAITSSLVGQIEEASAPAAQVGVTGRVVEPPAVPDGPSSPKLVVNLLVGLAIGLLVAFLTVVFRQALAAGSQER